MDGREPDEQEGWKTVGSRDLLAELHEEQCAHGSTLREVDRLRDLLASAEAQARQSDEGLIIAVERLRQIEKLLGGGRINWEPNYPEVQQALRIAQGHDG